MKKTSLLGATALRSIIFTGIAVAAAAPAFAQDTQTPPRGEDAPSTLQGEVATESATNPQDNETTGGAITVTGSRIRRPNLESTVPVTSVGGEEFFQTGQVSVGDVLNELPALRSTFSTSNSTRFLGTSGLNLLDLRGLGTQRTLVLVNGRRHVGGDILNNGVSVDTNTIPTDLIDRVDVVTGGNSAVYGSDAIAGVVNFVLKQNYDGVQIRGQGGISKYGDAGAYFVSALAGKNFADGRGNIAINVEYARQNQYFGDQRPTLRQQNGFVVVDSDPAGSVNGSDGIPDRVFFRDIRSATIANTGNILFASPTGACGKDPNGANYTCSYIFAPDGTLAPQTGTRIGLAPNGSFVGGNGESFRDENQFQLSPSLNRYNVNLIGHFTISPALEPFFEAKYARTESLGTGSSGPAFFQGSTIDGFYERPRLDNPFLSPQARAIITQQLTLANGTAPSASTRFALRLNLIGLGTRQEKATRETYRAVAGLRGDFNDDWHYEVSANYGETREKTEILGNLNTQRFLLAMDAIRNASGQIVCGSQVDPTRAYDDFGGNPATLAADIAACVPINPFGGQFTQAQRDYLVQNTFEHGKITQFVGSGFLTGDLSQLFELPGGPVSFAVGAEYRRETLSYHEDPLVEKGYTFYNAIPSFSAPAFEVKEAYGEIRIPVLKDMPFFQELTVSGAGRVASYKGKTGTVFAWNAGVDYAPVRDIRFRGNYSRAVRAPNLSDLYSPPGQNFAPGFGDPCSAVNIATGSSTRAANCLAAGIPASYDFRYSSSLEIVSGGNQDLKQETSSSWTLGGVLEPRFLPGFSASVDYYNITVKNVITAPSAQQIVNACYDAPDLNNQFCGLFQRAGAGGGPRGEQQFRILEGSLQQVLLNYAKLKARGVDTEIAYRHQIDPIGMLSTKLTWTHVLQRDSFLNPAVPNFADQILMELGDPKDAFNWNFEVKSGPVTFGYQLRYLSHMVLNAYEDFFSKQGRAPQNADYADRRFYPAVTYHDLRFEIAAGRQFSWYLGVDNVTNKLPPLGASGIGGGSAIYDNRGRFFYSGVQAKF